jgi:hypothetical protein
MPFKKVGQNDYTSPSGRHFTQKQVNLYYATNGFKEKPHVNDGKGRNPPGTQSTPRAERLSVEPAISLKKLTRFGLTRAPAQSRITRKQARVAHSLR